MRWATSRTPLLYSAAVVHGSLGLWALYKRREFHWKVPEVLQLSLGLAIPALILQHLAGLRLPVIMDDKQRYYAHALATGWSATICSSTRTSPCS